MTDIPPPQSDMPAPESDNKLTSDQFDEFKEALEVLYVIANISGRLQFAKAWPHAAEKVLGAELVQFDLDGAPDKEQRSALEQEAEGRRLEMLEFMDTLEEKSVDKGALQLEYVQGLIENMGRDLALYIYGVKIVDRFAPGPPPAPVVEESEAPAAVEAPPAAPIAPEVPPVVEAPAAPPVVAPVSAPFSPPPPAAAPVAQEPAPIEDAPVSNISLDPLDDIKPIDMSPPPAPVEAPPVPVEPVEASPPVEAVQPEISPPAPSVEVVQQPPAAPPTEGEAPQTQRPVSIQFVASKKEKDEEEDKGGTPPPSE